VCLVVAPAACNARDEREDANGARHNPGGDVVRVAPVPQSGAHARKVCPACLPGANRADDCQHKSGNTTHTVDDARQQQTIRATLDGAKQAERNQNQDTTSINVYNTLTQEEASVISVLKGVTSGNIAACSGGGKDERGNTEAQVAQDRGQQRKQNKNDGAFTHFVKVSHSRTQGLTLKE